MLIAAASFVALPATPAAASSPAASCAGQFAPIDAQNPDLHPLGLKVLALFTPHDVSSLVVPLAHTHDNCLPT
ncbi:MAG: hypothetical protein ACXV3F_07525 [Frankiaceae bacterium]